MSVILSCFRVITTRAFVYMFRVRVTKCCVFIGSLKRALMKSIVGALSLAFNTNRKSLFSCSVTLVPVLRSRETESAA